MGQNHHQSHDQNDYYTCPMHPEIKQDKPGKCPKCGGMNLVKKSELDTGEAYHDHASMMASPEAARDFLKRFYIVTVLLIPLAFFSMPAVEYLGAPDFAFRPYIELFIATIIFYYGIVFFEHASHEIKMRQYGMMTLVSLGVGSGYLFSVASTFIPAIPIEFYLEIATLIWILLFGHYLEAKSSTAAGDALQEVAKLLPKEAHLKVNGQTKDVEINSLEEGNVVIVKPGEKVPADGEIVKGTSNFNESHITGESKPVEKTKGDKVIAGAICIDGSVEIKLTQVGESSTIGQIQNLIASAKKTKPSAQKLADRASKWLTFTALSVAILTLIIWSVLVGETFVLSITLAITVLVIACPHALGLAIPTVSTIATKLAVQNGVFIKDMSKIEIVKKADYVVFDKTGTLTKGEFGVTDIKPLAEENEEKLLSIAASIESHSAHVIGMAIVNHAKNKKVKLSEVEDIKDIPGKGIKGTIENIKYYLSNQKLLQENSLLTDDLQKVSTKFSNEGKTIVFISTADRVLGVIALSDQIKDESENAIKKLHDIGIKVAMLTGDSKNAANFIAEKLNIDTIFAEVLPEDKYKQVKKLQDDGNTVIMAGDGVNDAPALTQANVGVAIGAGTDVAVEAGDIILTKSNPEDLVRLIVLSKKVYRKMIENLFWALGYNIVAIPAAAGIFIPLGFRLTPAVGAILMSLSSVIVVINAMSLRKTSLEVK